MTGNLDVHEDEFGAVGFGLGDSSLAISGFCDGVTRAGEEVAPACRAGLLGLRRRGCAWSCRALAELGADRQLHLKSRSSWPDAATPVPKRGAPLSSP